MELVRVKITATVITQRYGTLGPGDMLNTDLAFAKHLVDDCRAAKFVDSAAAKTDEPQTRKPANKAKKPKS